MTVLRAAGCVFAEDEAALLWAEARDPAQRAQWVARRVAGEPLEQIVGWAEFAGHRVRLAPGVFVPRQRSLLLVETAVARLGDGGRVVDLCCGSGAIGLAVASGADSVEVIAVDVDPVATDCASANLRAVGGQARAGDLYDALPPDWRGSVAVVVANAPYVPTDEIALLPPEAREYEPRHTLDGGPDGLAIARRVVAGAPAWLRPGGVVIIESSERQVDDLVAAMAAHGLRSEAVHDDERDATAAVGVAAGSD